MTGEQVVELLPKLRVIANAIWKNGLDADDLVQVGALALLETDNFRNPTVFAESRMRDHVRRHGWAFHSRGIRGRKRVCLSEVERVDLLCEARDRGEVWWGNLGLTGLEETVARLYCEYQWSLSEIGRRLGLTQIAVSHIWHRRVVKKVRERWGSRT